MCHCLSMSVMDKKVMQNEMTIVFNRFTLSPHTYKGKLSNMKNCCSSTLKTLYHTLVTIASWKNRCCPFLLWPSFVRIPWPSHSEPSLSTFNSQVSLKKSQSRIFCDLCDTWSMAIYSIHGRGRVWKRRGGGLREEKVEIVKTCIQKKKRRKSEICMYERGKGNVEA